MSAGVTRHNRGDNRPVSKEKKKEQKDSSHFVRGMGESTRHNTLAYGYSLALGGTFGVLNLQDKTTVPCILLFGLAGALPFSVLNPLVTRGFAQQTEEEPPIVLSLGASFGFVSIVGAIAVASLAGWLLGGWVAWMVGSFCASSTYLLLTGAEFVLARGLRALLGLGRLEKR